MRILLVLCLAVLTCGAQSGDLRLPTLGFAYDEELKVVRRISGIPGAAFLEPAGKGGELAGAAVSPAQDFALVAPAGDGELELVSLSANHGSRRPLGGVAGAVSRVTFSPSGKSAVVAADEAHVISGLPGAAEMRNAVMPDGRSAWPVIAVNDDGSAVLLASAGNPADPVWLSTRAGLSTLPLPGSVAAIAFRGPSSDAIAITRSGDVYLVRGADAQPEVLQVFSGDERTSDPLGVYFDAEGGRAYAVSRSGTLAILDLRRRSVTAASCKCLPSTLARLGPEGLFRLTEIPAGPVMLFDGRGAEPRVWFVPSDVRERSQGSEQ